MSKNNSPKYTKENIKKFFQLSVWTIKETFRLSVGNTALTIVLTIISAVIPTVLAFYSAKGLDLLIELVNSGATFSEAISLQRPYMQLLIFITLLVLVQKVLTEVLRYLNEKFRVIYLKNYELELHIKISEMDIARFEDPASSKAIIKAQENIWRIRNYVMSLFEILTGFVSLITSFSILFNHNWIFTIYLLISCIPSSIQSIRFVSIFYNFYNASLNNIMKRNEAKYYLVSHRSVTQNRVMLANTTLVNIFKRLNTPLVRDEMKINKDVAKSNIFLSFFYGFNQIVVPVVFLTDLFKGVITVGSFGFFTSTAYRFMQELDSLTNDVANLFDLAIGVEQVKAAFEIKNEIISGNIRIDTLFPPKIEFKDVSFKYINSKPYALKNLSITINPTEEIAIVGENGAGKTTFIKLLLRVFDPTEGEILVNGINLKEVNLESYYTAIGVLFQDYKVFDSLTIAENIALGVDKKFNLQQVKASAKLGEADKFIMSLPEGYNTTLGKSFEGGVNLSGGQEQKLALARMFYRDSPILILDEPTASIDPLAEYKIFKRIYEFVNNKSVIIISHRFSTVRNAQKIYVFEKGSIIEEGSHAELLKHDGLYAEAFHKQAEGYTKQN
ncbi:ABC transporter ATP-binding protein [bacterium]|nr:ABC transporter ATP-binding protein [bacterium]